MSSDKEREYREWNKCFWKYELVSLKLREKGLKLVFLNALEKTLGYN